MIEIRPGTADDADAVCDAHVAAWRVGYAHVFPDSVLYADDFESSRREFWRTWRFDHGCRVLVPVVDGRVVGFCSYGPERPRPRINAIRGEVWGFYVHPDHWGTGVAPALLAAAEDRLVRDGFPEAVLWVLDDNPRARAFYERESWAPSGRSATFDRYCEVHVPEVEYRKMLA